MRPLKEQRLLPCARLCNRVLLNVLLPTCSMTCWRSRCLPGPTMPAPVAWQFDRVPLSDYMGVEAAEEGARGMLVQFQAGVVLQAPP